MGRLYAVKQIGGTVAVLRRHILHAEAKYALRSLRLGAVVLKGAGNFLLGLTLHQSPKTRLTNFSVRRT